MVLAFSGQDILKSILRDHQHSSSIGEEVRGVTAGDNLLLKEETKTGLAQVAIRLHVNVTTEGWDCVHAPPPRLLLRRGPSPCILLWIAWYVI